jgi:hypothetical protein
MGREHTRRNQRGKRAVGSFPGLWGGPGKSPPIPNKTRQVNEALSKLSRVADVFAKRFQNPQRLANEVCGALHSSM